ncbi:MAG: hypothetical protein H7124_01155 [Phycisphaerales bacterium]|nr:hypothetical protein [Hyphomonadaceae bacterium]
MSADVTRDVISDLWPLYKTGEASADTVRLVETFLEQDGAFRTLLEKSEAISSGLARPHFSPDAELRLLSVARKRVIGTIVLASVSIGIVLFVIALAIHALK